MAAVLAGCTASRPVRIPVPDKYELNSGPYHIVMKSGKVHKAERILVSNDSAHFRDQAVPLKAIRSIEIRSFSFLKTAGFVAGAGIAAGALFVAYIVYFIIPGKLIH
jgi:hypothetical protein